MSCFYPFTGWQSPDGKHFSLHKQTRADQHRLDIACGGCLGCRAQKARAWALRCQLELQQHNKAAWATLTYDDEHLPPTLEPRHLQLWLKRLRKGSAAAGRIRFFGCGEYGEQNARPHYHVILFGLGVESRSLVADTWGSGRTQCEALTPALIAYTAGYSSKKIGWKQHTRHERVDPRTGEVYYWQPPFLQMSRRPGIGGAARQFVNSWRLYAISDGSKIPVPRFLADAYKRVASDAQIQQLISDKRVYATGKPQSTSDSRAAAEQILIARQSLQASARKL